MPEQSKLMSAAQVLDAAIVLPAMTTVVTYLTLAARDNASKYSDVELQNTIDLTLYFMTAYCTTYNTAKLLLTLVTSCRNDAITLRIIATMLCLLGVGELAYLSFRYQNPSSSDRTMLAVGISSSAISVVQRSMTSYLGIFGQANQFQLVDSVDSSDENQPILDLVDPPEQLETPRSMQ